MNVLNSVPPFNISLPEPRQLCGISYFLVMSLSERKLQESLKQPLDLFDFLLYFIVCLNHRHLCSYYHIFPLGPLLFCHLFVSWLTSSEPVVFSLFTLSSLRSTPDWTTNGVTLSNGWYCKTAPIPCVWCQSNARCSWEMSPTHMPLTLTLFICSLRIKATICGVCLFVFAENKPWCMCLCLHAHACLCAVCI